ncbi:MAG: hypothetical protein WB698_11090 [Solirubrobacteraceae bacterium]
MQKHLGLPAVPTRCMLAVLAIVVASLVAVAPASAAPKGEFANFAQCPLSNPATKGCVYAQSTSGEFDIGSTNVPLTKTITLQGGLTGANAEGYAEVLPATNGETLSKTSQTVPGGLLKIMAPSFLPGWLQAIFNEFIDKGITGVTATTELVGTAEIGLLNAITAKGNALILPTRVHLENPLLGGSCYIGSSSKPVTVEFTTGTTSPPAPNKPITGSPGEVSFGAGGAIVVVKNNSLVNNSFAAPEAEGCGGLLSFLIDPAVDAEIGLPSASGHNTAILNGSQEIGDNVESIRESEK